MTWDAVARRAILLVLAVAVWGATGCSGDVAGGGSAALTSPGSPAGSAIFPTGDPGSSALAALSDVSVAAVEEQDISADVLLTRVSLVLAPGATLGQLLAAAQEVGATDVAFSRPGSPFLDLVVPRQADIQQMKDLVARLDGFPGIILAHVTVQFQTEALPSAAGETAIKGDLQHLLPTRFPAAWNLRRLLETPGPDVLVLVADFFGGTHVNFDVQMEQSVVPPAFDPKVNSRHGFQVTGALTARFDALQSHGANPSPRSLDLRLLSFAGLGREQGQDRLFNAIESARGGTDPIIVNLSLGYSNQKSAELLGNSETDVRKRLLEQYLDGVHWASLTASPGFADRVLLIVAAGNDRGGTLVKDYPGLQAAQFSSPFACAAVIDTIETFATDASLWNPQPGILPDLRLDAASLKGLLAVRDALLQPGVATGRNLALVGSTNNRERVESLRISDFSDEGATVFAVGELVPLLSETGASDLEGSDDGTSFSAPQVAGLASYLWRLDDTLKAQPVAQTLRLIVATSRSNENLAGILDAYGAVMALDARRSDHRMRKELLDVSGPDGKFDERDLQAYETGYGLAVPGGPPDPLARDYSRFDLNGDGFTGGTGTERFDLDADGNDSEVLELIVDGEPVSFAEAALTDLDILTWYAYATGPGGGLLLYDDSGSDALGERSRILGPMTVIQAFVQEVLPDCPESIVNVDERTSSQTLPLAMVAGGTSMTVTRDSTGPGFQYSAHFTSTLPAGIRCPEPPGGDGRPARNPSSFATATLQFRSRRSGVLNVATVPFLVGGNGLVPQAPVQVVAGVPVQFTVDTRLGNGDQALSVTGVLMATVSFTPAP